MDYYTIAGIVIIVLVVTGVIASVRMYQRVRVKEGYQPGKFYRIGQHTGAFAGNYQMKKLGVMDGNTDDKVETDEEMYLFSESKETKE